MKAEYLDALEHQVAWLRQSNPRFVSTAEGRPFLEPLRGGTLFYVAPEFCGVLEAATPGLTGAVVQPDWLPEPCGFAWLARPVTRSQWTSESATPPLRAIGWWSDEQTCWFGGYTDAPKGPPGWWPAAGGTPPVFTRT